MISLILQDTRSTHKDPSHLHKATMNMRKRIKNTIPFKIPARKWNIWVKKKACTESMSRKWQNTDEDIKENQNQWRDIMYSWTGRQHGKDVNSP